MRYISIGRRSCDGIGSGVGGFFWLAGGREGRLLCGGGGGGEHGVGADGGEGAGGEAPIRVDGVSKRVCNCDGTNVVGSHLI